MKKRFVKKETKYASDTSYIGLEFLDFGHYVAKQIDKVDKRTRNGYIDFY